MLKTAGTEAMRRIDEPALAVAAHRACVDQPMARDLLAAARYLNDRAAAPRAEDATLSGNRR
jgi:hypothetical protein